jgi:uncharacterized membrane protein
VEEFFIALVPITFFLTVGGVLVLRPLTKRLGALMEASARAKGSTAEEQLQLEHMRLMIDTQNLKLEQLEQKLSFTESLLEARTSAFLSARTGAGPREIS